MHPVYLGVRLIYRVYRVGNASVFKKNVVNGNYS